MLAWIGTFLILTGAIMSSMDLYPWNVFAFNVGSVVWFIVAYRSKDTQLMVVNTGLIVIYFAGLLNSVL